MTIWKYTLEIIDLQEVAMPDGAEILSVAAQGNCLCLWAMVDPDREVRRRFIEIIGTGNPATTGVGIDRKFIGTVVMPRLVWHVFERM